MRRAGVWCLALLLLPFAFLAACVGDDPNNLLTGPRFTDED